MLRVVRYLVILLAEADLATHYPRRIRFACANEPTPRHRTDLPRLVTLEAHLLAVAGGFVAAWNKVMNLDRYDLA